MVTSQTFLSMLLSPQLHFTQENETQVYSRSFGNYIIKVDFEKKKIIYPSEIKVHRETTTNFSENENFVVFECVCRLLEKGYKASDIELEKPVPGGHNDSGGWSDIIISQNTGNEKEVLIIIECKKPDVFNDFWEKTCTEGSQLFNYYNSFRSAKWLCMYTSDFKDEKIYFQSNIICTKDNKEYLKIDKTLISFESYSKSSNFVKLVFNVWKTTYKGYFATKGIFEDDILPYSPGKNKYSINDLHEIDDKDIQKKYNEFATILRKYNVSGRENAFDKLVNLFLAKIIDETNNKNDLGFYWKGIAFDDDYQLQDRLLRLYRDGMNKFLNEEIVYIENDAVDNAFRFMKNDPDATKNKILECFRQLKYFSNNDFSFIEVHNKNLFEQNAVILKEIVRMFENIKLKTQEPNQFLGDLFEGFLDSGIKQSEGQFFTPLPIVRFIISSLPLKTFIENNKKPLKCIDYACGAGHFLIEYANLITPLLKDRNLSQKEYYSAIYGIEKEYRLSKVAKVGALMYGKDDINIVYSDALVNNEKIKNDTYNILISNPPYSVKGFLETLQDEYRDNFELSKNINDIAKNNAIETFFVEKAKQLLISDGVASIILPSSILNKSGLYTKCREIILKYFHIISIVKFENGTFGKTGTETVTLFLQRRKTDPDDAILYKQRIDSWFSKDDSKNNIYCDKSIIFEYCKHCNYNVDEYLDFIENKNIPNVDTFNDYKNFFTKEKSNKNSSVNLCEEANKIREEYNKKVTNKTFQKLPDTEKQNYRQEQLYSFICEIEKEKLYYFMLAFNNLHDVVIVKVPLNKDGKVNKEEIKSFLGYEWSSRKGDEGIKYLNIKQKKSSDDEGQDDTIEQLKGFNSIKTPMFNPYDVNDKNKINTIIRDNFLGKELDICDEVSPYINIYSLYDLIDFNNVGFSKEIKLQPIKDLQIKIPSNYKSERLEKYIFENDKSKLQVSSAKENKTGQYPFFTSGDNVYRANNFIVDDENIYLSTGGNATVKFYNGKASYSADTWCIKSKDDTQLFTQFLFICLESVKTEINNNFFKGLGLHHLPKRDFMRNTFIPIPPLEVQKRIVIECETIDKEVQKAKEEVEKGQKEIAKLFESVKGEKKTYKLSNSDDFEVFIGRRVLEKEFVKDGKFPVYSANVIIPFGMLDKSILGDFSMPSILWGIDGDWVVNYISENIPFMPTDHCGVLRVKNKEINTRFIVNQIKKQGEKLGFSRVNRASIERIKQITLFLPSLSVQEELVVKAQKIENEINKARLVIEEATRKKREVLKREL